MASPMLTLDTTPRPQTGPTHSPTTSPLRSARSPQYSTLQFICVDLPCPPLALTHSARPKPRTNRGDSALDATSDSDSNPDGDADDENEDEDDVLPAPCAITFRDRKGDAIPVSAALSRVSLHRMGCYALAGANICPLPHDAGPSILVAFQFPSREPVVRRIAVSSDDGHQAVTLAALAYKIAQELKTCLDVARKAGKPVRYNGRDVQVDKLVLTKLTRVSRTTWQPEFKLWC